MNKNIFLIVINFFNSKTGAVTLLGIVLLVLFSFNSLKEINSKYEMKVFREESYYKKNKSINIFYPREISVENWKVYEDKKRGFELKYPETWMSFVVENKNNEIAWEQKLVFREKSNQLSRLEEGFNVFIYNTSKISKNSDVRVLGCTSSQEICFENQSCLKENSYLIIKNEEYIYEIIPVLPEKSIFEKNKEIPLVCNSDEIIASVSSFKTINIVRPKPKPIITAPYPVSYKKVNGKLVCAKKNDKPRKSKKDKGHHLDMECCLDPDEDPNPWCTYF